MLNRKPAAQSLSLALVVSVCLVAAPSCGQNLVSKLNKRMASPSDPIELLRASAEYAQNAERLSTTLVATRRIVAGETDQSDQEVFDIRMAKPDKYAIEMVKPSPEFWVRSNGEETMTYLMPLERFTVTSDAGGISDFAETRIATRIGSQVGALVFSLLGSQSVEDVIESVTESEYIGEETVDDVTMHHCRYTTGGLTWEAWFATGDAPLVRRVTPNLSEMAAQLPLAAQFDNFRFDLTFGFEDVDTKTALPDDAFALKPPAGAEKVDAADLFAPPEQPPHPLLGQAAPVFEATDLAGEPIDLGSKIGKEVIILDFWATWCGPCVAALPRVNEVADDYKDKGVAFYAVNQGEGVETVEEFLKTQELELPVAMDPDGAVGAEYGVQGLPTSFLIGKDGKVQVVHVGFSQELKQTLTGELDALLAGDNLAQEKLDAWAKKQEAKRARQEALEAEYGGDGEGAAGGE